MCGGRKSGSPLNQPYCQSMTRAADERSSQSLKPACTANRRLWAACVDSDQKVGLSERKVSELTKRARREREALMLFFVAFRGTILEGMQKGESSSPRTHPETAQLKGLEKAFPASSVHFYLQRTSGSSAFEPKFLPILLCVFCCQNSWRWDILV